ncbi:MAG: hypothetical protein QOF01_4566 [Thermomicrobiales bacterium]|jgi:hypothetical protein|nr:hypothetical protein [Thermomicrobiales bacterium]
MIKPFDAVDHLVCRGLVKQSQQASENLTVRKQWGRLAEDNPRVVLPMRDPRVRYDGEIGLIIGEERASIGGSPLEMLLFWEGMMTGLDGGDGVETVRPEIAGKTGMGVVVEIQTDRQPFDRHA